MKTLSARKTAYSAEQTGTVTPQPRQNRPWDRKHLDRLRVCTLRNRQDTKDA